MSITVSCECGTTFSVTDNHAEGNVNCQSCGTAIVVGQTSCDSPLLPTDIQNDDSDDMECPICAELIKRNAKICRHCGEAIQIKLSDKEIRQRKRGILQALDEYLADDRALQREKEGKGGLLSKTSVVLMSLSALSIAGLAFSDQLFRRNTASGIFAISIVSLCIFGLAALISFFNDQAAQGISSSSNSKQAIKRWFKSIRNGRAKKAFYAVAPTGRKDDAIKSLTFEKIPENTGLFSIKSPSAFAKYWKSITKGPSMQLRQMLVKKVNVETRDPEGFAVAEIHVQFTSFPTLAILGIFGGILLAVILILALQKQETQVIKKLLVNRKDRWFVVEGQYQGELDLI